MRLGCHLLCAACFTFPNVFFMGMQAEYSVSPLVSTPKRVSVGAVHHVSNKVYEHNVPGFILRVANVCTLKCEGRVQLKLALAYFLCSDVLQTEICCVYLFSYYATH